MPATLLPLTLAVPVLVTVLAALFALVSVLMMLIILVQKPKGGGLSGAFGGAGGNEGAFVGAKVGDFLTIVTASCFVVFVLLAMGLTWTTTPEAEAAVPVFEIPMDDAAAAEAEAAPAGDAAETATADGADGATPITPTTGDDPDSATANNANREPVAADMTAHDLVDDVLDAVAGEPADPQPGPGTPAPAAD
ncbi:preprotein translocase subunit SecG [Phycisphaera mikurensis]|uniref:Protein-export membrane protein SecG n=1 Tax=Phycisphaera mikurensis (strain NBRC 102666 / KCTC 22515 / FYK2301M01) TaxID=1142394 RepID=I0IBN5_PHYMF|nr:preprotein translocase subunit SecG [Phycisphaera mikurensis]MBB6442798.1 preprotein translocase subunit SecG [Phycisphaera mikurensis]BAM02673.1 putative protein-export membrane protein SecG [Phycisphaera mikurensis NBRC 102666]